MVMTTNPRRTLWHYMRAVVRRSYRGAYRVYRGVRWLLLPILYHDKIVHIDGFSIKVHSVREYISQQLIDHGGYEQGDIKVLCSLLQRGDSVLDIGANIGLHTLYLSRAVGAHGRVMAFEPDPENLALLRHNVTANNCTNVSIQPYALGAESGTAELFLCDNNKGYQSMANLSGSGKSIHIDVRTADEIIGDATVALIKMDVEGAEPLVLQGMRSWPDQLFFEFVPKQVRAFGNDPTAFLQMLLDRGYALYQVEGEWLLPTSPAEMTEIAEISWRDHNVLARKIGPRTGKAQHV